MATPLELNDIWLERIRQNVDGLEFGNVQIIIHEGRIVQIERTERKRFEAEQQARPTNRQDPGPAKSAAPKPSIDNRSGRRYN